MDEPKWNQLEIMRVVLLSLKIRKPIYNSTQILVTKNILFS